MAALLLCTLTFLMNDASHPAPGYAALALKPGDFIVGMVDGLRVVDRATGAVTNPSTDPRYGASDQVATGLNGELYSAGTYIVSDSDSVRGIFRIDPATGATALVTSGAFQEFRGLTTDRDGNLLVLEPTRITRVNPSTGAPSTVASGGKIADASGLAVESDGSVLTTAPVSPGMPGSLRQVIRIRAGTGAQEIVSTGAFLVQPHYVAVHPDGTIFVTDQGGSVTLQRVLRVHPQTGAQAIVGQYSGNGPWGILIDSTGTGYVTGGDSMTCTSCLFRMNLSNGALVRLNATEDILAPRGLAIVQVGSPLPCPTRSPISVTTTKLGNGRLRANVHANGTPNTIRNITFTPALNAAIESPPTITGADATFVVQRTAPGYVTVKFTVTDACGNWNSFVGGGPNAF